MDIGRIFGKRKWTEAKKRPKEKDRELPVRRLTDMDRLWAGSLKFDRFLVDIARLTR